MSDSRSDVERNAQMNMEEKTAGQSQIQNAVADSTNDQLSSPILKLNVDCFEELFEWLSIADCRALRQTCKRLKRVVDYFIKTNYPAALDYTSITLLPSSVHEFRKVEPTRVKIIKSIRIGGSMINEIDILQCILPGVERLDIEISEFRGDFYDSILKWCSNIRCLKIRSYGVLGIGWNGLLQRRYPKIEYVAIYSFNNFVRTGIAGEFRELKTFFELNSGIQTFSTTMHFLRVNSNCFLGPNIKIKTLCIMLTNECFLGSESVYPIYVLLKQLHEQGFYERLHLHLGTININRQEKLDRIALIPGMEYLNLQHIGDTGFTLPAMPDLKMLSCGWNPPSDLVSVAKNLVSVERVCTFNLDDIIPFIRHAPKVKEIKVNFLVKSVYLKNNVIDLSALNKERKELAGANKITLYVGEKVFLSTKMAMMKTEFSLITLKRTEAAVWNVDDF